MLVLLVSILNLNSTEKLKSLSLLCMLSTNLFHVKKEIPPRGEKPLGFSKPYHLPEQRA